MLIVLFNFFSYFFCPKANGTVTISWVYRGTQISSNTSLSLNVGDSLQLKCTAISNFATVNGVAPVFMLLFGPSSTVNPTVSITFTAGTAPRTMQDTISVSGTLIYDSFNGVKSTWSHWIIMDKVSPGSAFGAAQNAVSTSWLTISIPSLISSDAGTLYCAYAEGNTVLTSQIGISNGISLSLTTKSTANRLLFQTTQKDQLFMSYYFLLISSSSFILLL